MTYQSEVSKAEELLLHFIKDEAEGVAGYKKLLKFVEKYGNHEDIEEIELIIRDEEEHLEYVKQLYNNYFVR